MRKKKVTLWDLLGKVPDHRNTLGRRYSLRSVLAITLAAVLSGRTSLAAIARFGRRLKDNTRQEMGIYRKQAPCHATYHNIFRGLDIAALEQVLANWVRALAGEKVLGHVAIDGKRLRGSRDGEYPGVHLLAAYCEAVSGVVDQLPVSRSENEIPAALRLLKKMPLEGVVVTGDAMFTQKEICQTIIDGGGDYFFTVKDNQKTLRDDIAAAFEPPSSPLRGETVAAGSHGS